MNIANWVAPRIRMSIGGRAVAQPHEARPERPERVLQFLLYDEAQPAVVDQAAGGGDRPDAARPHAPRLGRTSSGRTDGRTDGRSVAEVHAPAFVERTLTTARPSAARVRLHGFTPERAAHRVDSGTIGRPVAAWAGLASLIGIRQPCR